MQIWQGYRRASPGRVREVLAALAVGPPTSFVEFFTKYEGVFGSSQTSFELCALCESEGEPNENTSIPLATELCRNTHGLPTQFLVLSNMVALSFLVYDTERDLVYNMDLEGGVELLKQGKLRPSFNSFAEFLAWYFKADGTADA